MTVIKAKKYTLLIPFFLLGIILITLLLPLYFSKITPFSSLGFLALVEELPDKTITNYKTSEILKGEKISGIIKSKENNLGIVLIRFDNFERISKDKVTFRIREKGENKWYYNNTYKVDQFQPDEYFTFGFPVVINAKGKQYEFEIESQTGKPYDAIALSKISPHAALVYQYSKSDLFNSIDTPLTFLYKKSIYAISHVNKLLLLQLWAISVVVIAGSYNSIALINLLRKRKARLEPGQRNSLLIDWRN